MIEISIGGTQMPPPAVAYHRSEDAKSTGKAGQSEQ